MDPALVNVSGYTSALQLCHQGELYKSVSAQQQSDGIIRPILPTAVKVNNAKDKQLITHPPI